MDPGCWTGRVHLHIFSSTNTSLRDTGQFPPCRTASEACFTCTMNLETYTLTVSTTKIRLECLVSRWDLCRGRQTLYLLKDALPDSATQAGKLSWRHTWLTWLTLFFFFKYTLFIQMTAIYSSFLVQLFSVIHLKCTITEHKSRTWFDWLIYLFFLFLMCHA